MGRPGGPSNPNSPGDNFIIIDWREAAGQAGASHDDGSIIIEWQPDPELTGNAGELSLPAVQAESFRPTEALCPPCRLNCLCPPCRPRFGTTLSSCDAS